MKDILDGLRESIIVVGRDGNVSYANDAMLKACRLKRSDVVGKKCTDLQDYCPLLSEEHVCPLEEVLETGKTVIRNYESMSPEGLRKVLEVECLPLTNGSGKAVSMVEIVRDVSREAEIEELLERSAEGMTILHEVSSAFLVSKGLHSALKTALDLIGDYFEADFLKVSVPDGEGKCFDLLASTGWCDEPPGEDISRQYMDGYCIIEKCPAIVTDYRMEGRFKRPSMYEEHGIVGGICVPMVVEDKAFGVLCILYKRPIGIHTAELWYLNVFANSLAVYIQKERSFSRLEESEAFLSSILESLGEGVVVVDRDMRIKSSNKAYLDMNKLTLEEVLGRHCYEVSHGQDVPCHETGESCTVKGVFETGRPHSALHTHVTKDGSHLYVQTHAYPIFNNFREVVAAVETVSDITEKYKLERDLEKRVAELEEFYEMAVGRELRMIELKEEIARLRHELEMYRSK